MPNHGQFVRQTAAVSLAFGLIGSLLPGFASAHDGSTREACAARLIGPFCVAHRGMPQRQRMIRPNAFSSSVHR